MGCSCVGFVGCQEGKCGVGCFVVKEGALHFEECGLWDATNEVGDHHHLKNHNHGNET